MHRTTRRLMPSIITAAAALSAAALAASAASAQAPASAIATSTAAAGMRYQATEADNHLRVTLAGTTFTLDDIVPIQAGAGCAPIAGDATKVTCVAFKAAPRQFKQFVVLAGPGDDTVVNDTSTTTTPGVAMLVFGNAGKDTLIGNAKAADDLHGESGDDDLRGLGGGFDTLSGGTGDDELLGGAGSDTMNGGSGNDDLDGRAGDDTLDAGTGADVIDGGTEDGFRDTVVYADRANGVTVDLAATASHQGEPGEGDLIVRVENVIGGRGNDTLLGNDANNNLIGNDGNDHLDGRTGRDQLIGGFGRDILIPSSNPDGEIDVMDCDNFGLSDGSNGDLAVRFPADNDIANDCEQVLDA
jgi:Ca2+-binding RTX toxin-like protein